MYVQMYVVLLSSMVKIQASSSLYMKHKMLLSCYLWRFMYILSVLTQTRFVSYEQSKEKMVSGPVFVGDVLNLNK